MMKPITPTLLASAIECAMQGKLKASEHQRFFVEHYRDKLMEHARKEGRLESETLHHNSLRAGIFIGYRP